MLQWGNCKLLHINIFISGYAYSLALRVVPLHTRVPQLRSGKMRTVINRHRPISSYCFQTHWKPTCSVFRLCLGSYNIPWKLCFLGNYPISHKNSIFANVTAILLKQAPCAHSTNISFVVKFFIHIYLLGVIIPVGEGSSSFNVISYFSVVCMKHYQSLSWRGLPFHKRYPTRKCFVYLLEPITALW